MVLFKTMREKIKKHHRLIFFSLVFLFFASFIITESNNFLIKAQEGTTDLELTGSNLEVSPTIIGVTARDDNPSRFRAVSGRILKISGKAKDLVSGLKNLTWEHQVEHDNTIETVAKYDWLTDGTGGFSNVTEGIWSASTTEVNWTTLEMNLRLWVVNKIIFIAENNENQTTNLTLNLVSEVSPEAPPGPEQVEIYPQCVDEELRAMNVTLTEPDDYPENPYVLSGYYVYRCLGDECTEPGPYWTYLDSCYRPLDSGLCFTDYDIKEPELFTEQNEVEVQYHLRPFIQASDEFDTIMGNLMDEKHINEWSHKVYGTESNPYGMVIAADYCHPIVNDENSLNEGDTNEETDPNQNSDTGETDTSTRESEGSTGGGSLVLPEGYTETKNSEEENVTTTETESNPDETLSMDEGDAEAENDPDEALSTDGEISTQELNTDEENEAETETPTTEEEIKIATETTEEEVNLSTETQENLEYEHHKALEEYLRLFVDEGLVSEEYFNELMEGIKGDDVNENMFYELLLKLYTDYGSGEIDDVESILSEFIDMNRKTKLLVETLEKPGIVNLEELAEKGVTFPDPREVPDEETDENLTVENIEVAEINKETEKISKIRLSGKGVPDSILLLFIYSQPIVVSVKTDNNGYWEYQFEEEMPDGEHFVYVAKIDESGLIKSQSKPFRFVKEAQAVEFTPQISMATESSNSSFLSFITIFAVVFALIALLIFSLFFIGSKKKIQQEKVGNLNQEQ